MLWCCARRSVWSSRAIPSAQSPVRQPRGWCSMPGYPMSPPATRVDVEGPHEPFWRRSPPARDLRRSPSPPLTSLQRRGSERGCHHPGLGGVRPGRLTHWSNRVIYSDDDGGLGDPGEPVGPAVLALNIAELSSTASGRLGVWPPTASTDTGLVWPFIIAGGRRMQKSGL